MCLMQCVWGLCVLSVPLRDVCMQALTFLKMAPWPGGKVDVKYRRVNCVPPKDIGVSIDNNRGEGGWLRLQITVTSPAARV